MTDKNELRELCERIGRLPLGHILYLFEMALADHRRRHEETLAEMLAADAAFLELEKRQRASDASATIPPEAKREAG